MADPATESARLAARLGRRAQRELWSANSRSACRSVERPLPREANGWKGSIAPSNGRFQAPRAASRCSWFLTRWCCETRANRRNKMAPHLPPAGDGRAGRSERGAPLDARDEVVRERTQGQRGPR
jgi:hypothetical protein